MSPQTDRVIDEFEGQLGVGRLSSRLLTIALAALSSRALVWAAVLGGGGVWTYAVLRPEPLRLVAATLYCLTLLLPVLYRDAKGG